MYWTYHKRHKIHRRGCGCTGVPLQGEPVSPGVKRNELEKVASVRKACLVPLQGTLAEADGEVGEECKVPHVDATRQPMSRYRTMLVDYRADELTERQAILSEMARLNNMNKGKRQDVRRVALYSSP